MNERPIEDRLSHDTCSARRQWVHPLEHLAHRGGDAVMVSDQMNKMTVEAIYSCRHSVTQLHHAFDDRVEDRLDISGRLTDHTQDLARCRLLLERLRHLSMRLRQSVVLLLELSEQPHVLDGDHGLVGES